MVKTMAKEVFNVKGVNLTAHEKAVYEKVAEKGAVNYNEIATDCNISVKSAIATLARLEKTHGLLKKNEPVKTVTYEVSE
jgi:predicted transcriptional regulator